jgi:phosphoribosyl 1,2-cyclic phosphodiesterase
MSTPGKLAITVLGSGSRGNAMVIHDGSDGILVDAGFSAVDLRRRLARAGIAEGMLRGIIITHEHDDHIKGVRVLSQQLSLPVFATGETSRALRGGDPKLGPLRVFAAGQQFDLAGFTIRSFSIPHDAADPIGLVIVRNGIRAAVATDLGHVTRLVEQHLRECDILLLESNHDIKMVYDSARPMYVKQRILGNNGHLCNKVAMELLAKVLHPKTRHLILGHISGECNTHGLVEQCARECLEQLKRDDLKARIALQNDVLETLWAD